MGKETKFGLLVGLVFIILFGVILGGRVGSAAGDHAPLPVGDSGDHQVLVDTLLGSDDPLGPDGPSLAIDDPSPVRTEQPAADPAEEPMPAPEDREPEASESAEEAPTGRLAFGPARVETPTPAPGPAEAPPKEAEQANDASVAASGTPPPAALKRPVHLVAKGETLTAIACRYYGADAARLWRRIWEANKERLPDPDRLKCGQSLVIPGLPAEMPTPEAEVADAGAAEDAGEQEAAPSATLETLARRFRVRLDEGEVAGDPAETPPTYTVRKGDTFYRIARKVYGEASLAGKLVRKNRDRVPDARRLRIGQTILLLEEPRTAARPDAPDGRLARAACR